MRELETFKEAFDPLFQTYLETKLFSQASGSCLLRNNSLLSVHLWQVVSSGKRLRPFVAHLAFSAHSNGEKDARELEQCMLAVELFHAFAVIHDDLIDASDARHGVASFHCRFSSAHALLMGDLCFSRAVECMYHDSVGAIPKMLFDKMAAETIMGQLSELEAKDFPKSDSEEVSDVALYKTARYTFTYPMLIGLAASGDLSQYRVYRDIGDTLGQAYQRIDDLADIFLDEDALGKPPCGDIERGIRTHIMHRLRGVLSGSEFKTVESYKGSEIADDTIASIRMLVRTSGCLALEVAEIHQMLDGVWALIDTLVILEEYLDQWTAILRMMADSLDRF